MESYKMCGCFTRKFSAVSIQPPDDVKEIFERYADGVQMTADGLRRFLTEFQKENEEFTTEPVVEGIIEQIRQRRRHLGKFTRHAFLTLEDFFHFLSSPDLNPVFNSQVHHDMSAPLSHYYIFTGHNSYLTGNQLNSDCSDVPIIKALHRGVRVIELDMWPNLNKDDVIVLHGRTLTTPVELIKCLRSIKEHAFTASPYPVIITLEDHLNAELQAKVAEMITQTFGDMLFFPDSGTLQEFPSPESLKYRVMISTKPPKEYLESSTFKDSGSQRVKDDVDSWGKEVPDVKEEIESNSKNDVDASEPNTDGDDPEDEDQRMSQSVAKGVSEYRRKPNGGMESWLKVEAGKVRRLSLSEQEVAKAVTTRAADLVRFTQHNLLRIYPKGIRIDSSNYNPLIGWMYGGQLVALNMQVGIAGVHADTIMKKTRMVEDNWSPVWNEGSQFPLSVPELALLRVEVHEYDVSEKDDFGGQTCLPVSELKTGIRCVPLFDKKGYQFNSVKLLMKLELS